MIRSFIGLAELFYRQLPQQFCCLRDLSDQHDEIGKGYRIRLEPALEKTAYNCKPELGSFQPTKAIDGNSEGQRGIAASSPQHSTIC